MDQYTSCYDSLPYHYRVRCENHIHANYAVVRIVEFAPCCSGTSICCEWSVHPRHLALRSTRTPPALPSVLSQHSSFSASLNASVQAWPVSFIRRSEEHTSELQSRQYLVCRL